MKTITWRTATALAVLFAAAAGCYVPDLERFDPVSGVQRVEGINAPVKIVRDQNGIAHVIAENDEDLFFAAGYAMAQDRFVIMDLYRRAGGGMLSELLGSPLKFKSLDLPHLDIALRTFRFNEAAKEGVAGLDPESRRQLEAFTRGVNKYLEQGGDTIPLYKTLKTKPEPWRIEDCFLVAGISGLTMTLGSLFEEYYLERIRLEHGEEVRDLFVPEYPDDAAIITRDSLLTAWLPRIPSPLGRLGSNNWVVSASRSVSGKPIICNDPHVPFSIIPTYWWHCHLESPGYHIMGMMFPGFPCFGAATNGKLAWALTNVMADYVDLWREKVNPENPDLYLDEDGNWTRFRMETGEVRIRGKKPLKYTMRLTRHGVVLEKPLLGWKIASAPGEVITVRYVDIDFARFYRGYQKMARAENFKQWLAGAADEAWGPFAWNHVYADQEGNIAYWATGHFPLRADNQGYIARRGWDKTQDWQGYVPFEKNPHLVNPKKAYIVTANNRVETPGYPYYITVDYVSPARASRISELIEAKPKLSAEDMKRIQYDVTVWGARFMVPVILSDLEGASSRKLRKAAQLLEEWKQQGYVAETDSRGTCVYEVFMQKFPKAVFGDEMGKASSRGAGYAGLFSSALDKILDKPDSPWFDDVKTKKKETRKDITRKAMKETMKYLETKLGPNPEKWRWGRLSRLWLSPSFVPIPGFTKKLSRGPYPLPGTMETVRAAGQVFLGPLGFYGFVGPSTHIIIDFKDPERAWFNATAGMADNDKGGRYDNLMPAWLEDRYLLMSMRESDYRQGMMGELTLAPSRE